MKIAYFGIEGSYTYFAAKKYFGDDGVLIGNKTFNDVFEQIDSGGCAYGIIPIENSLAGSVVENYDNLLRYGTWVSGEVYLEIEHCLLGRNNQDPNHNNQIITNNQSSISKLKRVYGHPQALAQCGRFFAEHPDIEQIAWGDNASAAKFVGEQRDESWAAIASRETGEMYGLDVLAKGIADERVNITRFLIVSKNAGLRSENEISYRDKISLYFTVRHEVGSLVRVLDSLQKMGVNLVKIESKPIKGTAFEYGFFVEGVFKGALDIALIEGVSNIKVLGQYRFNVSD